MEYYHQPIADSLFVTVLAKNICGNLAAPTVPVLIKCNGSRYMLVCNSEGLINCIKLVTELF